MDSLQTGDVSEEGGSGQTAEDKHRIVTLQTPELEFVPPSVVAGHVREWIAERRCLPVELLIDAVPRRFRSLRILRGWLALCCVEEAQAEQQTRGKYK